MIRVGVQVWLVAAVNAIVAVPGSMVVLVVATGVVVWLVRCACMAELLLYVPLPVDVWSSRRESRIASCSWRSSAIRSEG